MIVHESIMRKYLTEMFSVFKKLLDSFVGSTVADCHDQTSLEEYASSTDLAMEKTMDTPSAIVETSTHDSIMQRTEATSVKRSHTPMKHSKTRAHLAEEVLLQISSFCCPSFKCQDNTIRQRCSASSQRDVQS